MAALVGNACFSFFRACDHTACGIMGRATESLSCYAGSRVGGFLNATFGNATELIIGFFAMKAGCSMS
jgi:calcium/proton exchanger cax